MAETLLLPSDVAKMAGVTHFTVVHDWVRKGLLPVAFTTPGGYRLFDPQTVKRFLKQRAKRQGKR